VFSVTIVVIVFLVELKPRYRAVWFFRHRHPARVRDDTAVQMTGFFMT
jgi:hypothetical protein